jgi:predicted permease
MFTRKRRLNDFSAEINEHIRLEVERLEEQGFTEDEARSAALRSFGNVTLACERFYESRRWLGWDHLCQDVRYCLRTMRKSPGFAIIAVLTLALGIGANTAIFSVLNSVLLRNLPVTDPQQLVLLTNPDAQGMEAGFGDGDRDLVTYPEFQELARNNRVFSGLLAASSSTREIPVELEGPNSGGNGARAEVSLVSGSYFSVLGVAPMLGTVFTTEVDELRDANPVAVISYRFWQDRFGGVPDVLGRRIRILSTSYDVIGVAPPQFNGETVGADPAIWVPLSMQSEIFPGRDFLSLESNPFHKIEWLQAIGRLKPGVTFAQAKAAIGVEFQQMMQSQADSMSAHDKNQFLNQRLPVAEGGRGASTLRDSFGKPLQILMVVVGLILLIACANVANILLARSTARQKEITVRVAMGARASRLLRQLFTESILLAFIGGAFGLLFARWADDALLRMVSGGPTPIALDVHPDAKILAFTLILSVLTGILFGLAPAFRAVRLDLNSVLKGTSRAVAGGGHGRVPLGKGLVVAQVAISLLLLVVAGLFLHSFRNLALVRLGYDQDHLLMFHADPLSYGYQRPQVPALYDDMLRRLSAIPGVRAASLDDNGIMGGTDSQDSISIEGQKPKAGDENEARWDFVGPSFFSATGIPILAGREIRTQDSGNGQRVGVVNHTFARKYFPDSNPIGRRVLVLETTGHFDFVIVGVAADSKHGSVREKPFPRFYVPFFNPIGDEWATSATIVARTSGDPSAAISAIRASVRQSAPNLPPVEIQTMNQRVARSLATDRMITQLAGAFGILAVILVCIGLYGIMAYAVSGRTNEIGIRIALGAQRRNILWLILRDALLLVLIGVAIGLPVVFGAGKWVSSLLFGVKPEDPAAIALAAMLMFLVGSLASYLPARRAMRVDPMVALRYE